MRKRNINLKRALLLTIGIFFLWYFYKLPKRSIAMNYSLLSEGSFSNNLTNYLHHCKALYLAYANEEKIAFSNCRLQSDFFDHDLEKNVALVTLQVRENLPIIVNTSGPPVYILKRHWFETERKICKNKYLSGITWILPIDPFYFNGNIAHLHIFGAMRIWNTLQQLKSKGVFVNRILFVRRPSLMKCCPSRKQILETVSRLETIFPLEVVFQEQPVCIRQFLFVPLAPGSQNIHWGASHHVPSTANTKESFLIQAYADYLKKALLKNYSFLMKNRKRIQPHVIFVKRTGRRQLFNVEQLAVWSRSKEVTASVVDFSRGTWREHAKIVSGTDIFFSCHGADLTNMLFLPSRSVVVEIFPYKMAINYGFEVMARYLGMKYMRYQEHDFQSAVPYDGAECMQVFSNWSSLENIPAPSKTRGKQLDKCTNYMHTNLTQKSFMDLLERALFLLHS